MALAETGLIMPPREMASLITVPSPCFALFHSTNHYLTYLPFARHLFFFSSPVECRAREHRDFVSSAYLQILERKYLTEPNQHAECCGWRDFTCIAAFDPYNTAVNVAAQVSSSPPYRGGD